MLNEKIGKLISELDTATAILAVAAMKDAMVRQAIEKINNVSIELSNLIDDIETEKAIDRCNLRKLAIYNEMGDCGRGENGKCIGYTNSGGEPCDECKECVYQVNYDEERWLYDNRTNI